jgi:hypothetical protein
MVTTTVTVTPHNKSPPDHASPRKATIPTIPSSARGSPATASAAAAAVPLMGTASVRTGSGHVLIRTFAYPKCYLPSPSDLQKPAGIHGTSFYGVSVGQQCGIFPDWYVRQLVPIINSLLTIYRDSVEARTKGVPGARQKKFSTWDLAHGWYTAEYVSDVSCCKPFVGGPFDPHDAAEAELAQMFSAYMTVWFVLTASPVEHMLTRGPDLLPWLPCAPIFLHP